MMRAVRLHDAGGPEDLVIDRIETPALHAGEALVRVHAAAITRDELDWVEDRFPAIPAYELSGVVAAIADGVDTVAVGAPVFALTRFDRDGVAADYAVVPADMLVAKPATLDDVESAAVPLPSLSAWQGLFAHGKLEPGQRVLITGAGGGVGHLAVQLARRAGAEVIGTASASGAGIARDAGAGEVIDPISEGSEISLDPVDLVFDTAGGDGLARSPSLIREGGTIVSIAEEPPEGVDAIYFIVEPDTAQLAEIGRIIDEGALRPMIDSVYPLEDARAAFERNQSPGKRGKVALLVAE
jgi:NADPH:quinone reductase-like Zn-dependent oxidoreductase